MKKWIFAVSAAALVLALGLSGCEKAPADSSGSATEVSGTGATAADPATGETPTGSETAGETGGNTTPATQTIQLTFSGQTLSGAPEGTVVTEDGAFVIVKPGTYELTGDLSNGQLRVRVEKTERVTLIFRNFTASSSTSAPIYLVSADKCVIELADGSVNRLTDAKTYVFSDPTENKPNACLYAGCDLKIKGKGSLIVEGNYNNGIGCKNDLEISQAASWCFPAARTPSSPMRRSRRARVIS